MSTQATEIARCIHQAIAAAATSSVASLDSLETPVCWPGQPRNVWPKADISGHTSRGEFFIVEIDDHADPARSVVKYWPFLHSLAAGEAELGRVAFVAVSRRDDTFGAGFEFLARFIGERLAALYPEHYRFKYINLAEGDAPEIAKAVLAFLDEDGQERV